MSLPLGLKPVDIVRGLAAIAEKSATALPGPWGVALTWIAEGAELGAEIADHAMDPVIMIREFRSILPGYRAAQTRLRDRIAAIATEP